METKIVFFVVYEGTNESCFGSTDGRPVAFATHEEAVERQKMINPEWATEIREGVVALEAIN